MEIIVGLLFFGFLGYLFLVAWFGMVNSAAGLAKEIIKQAIKESKEEAGDWDDFK